MAIELLAPSDNKKNPSVDSGYATKPLVDTITNGFFSVDRKWTVQYWNDAAEKLLKVPARDIIGRNLWEKFADIIPIDFYPVYYKAFQQNAPFHFREYWGEMGAWFDVVLYNYDDILSVSFKSSNHPARIENDQSAEQQLKVLNELYRLVTEITNDCLWEWELEAHEFFWIDGGHKRVFGYHIENALIPQRFWESCLHPDDKQRVLTNLNKVIGEGTAGVWEDEYRFKKADGSYAYVEDRGFIFYNDKGQATRMIGATRDITAKTQTEILLIESERKLSQFARQRFNDQARKAEIPMANINLAVQMLEAASNENDRKIFLNVISRSTARITQLLSEITE